MTPPTPIPLAPEDFTDAERARAAALGGAIRLEEVHDPESADFDAAYRMMDAFFGPRGEVEAREVLAGFLRDRLIHYGDHAEGTYHLVTAWHGDRLVGVRDCYVDLDHARQISLVALSHSIVVPEWRRAGVATLLRAVPVALARRVQQERCGEIWPTLIAAEMEPIDPSDPGSFSRLVAYGRAGFRVFDPQRFRYAQPDFRCLPDAAHTGIAMLGVVRPVGLPVDHMSPDICEVYPRLFHACHRMYLPASQVDPSEAHALLHLRASEAPVALLRLPDSPDDIEAVAPLTRDAVWPLYPPGLRGPFAAENPLQRELQADECAHAHEDERHESPQQPGRA
jgi:hypothetical protein